LIKLKHARILVIGTQCKYLSACLRWRNTEAVVWIHLHSRSIDFAVW